MRGGYEVVYFTLAMCPASDAKGFTGRVPMRHIPDKFPQFFRPPIFTQINMESVYHSELAGARRRSLNQS